MRRIAMLVFFVLSLGVAARAQEEIFSKYVQVFRPQGDFPHRLIKALPAAGGGWRMVQDQRTGYRIYVPDSSEIDTQRVEDRVLRVVLAGSAGGPKPVLRIHAFKPGPEDPEDIDVDYVTDYVEQYPDAAFKGRFTVTDSGMLALPDKVNLAMLSGVYLQGAASARRVECSFLSKEQQLFVTFDCSEKEFEQYADRVARILLSFEILGRKKR